MKKLLLITATVFFIQTSNAQTTIDYFGQTPPGDTPKKFAAYPSGSLPMLHSCPSFSPSGDEAFWATWPDISNYIQTIYFRKKENGNWTNPSIVPFSGGDYSDKLPCFSGDGQRVYFTSDRPRSGKGNPIDENIWYIEKNTTGWSDPICLDNSVNTTQNEGWISVAANNNLYFGRNDKLYFAKWEKDHFLPAKALPNYPSNIDAFGCIAPDESYIILQSVYTENNSGDWIDDLYIIFQPQDVASKPIKLGSKINSMISKSFAKISPDGKYLFFLGDNSDAYWVSTAFVEKLRPSTGINEIYNFDKKLTLFPNPTTGRITLSLGTTQHKEALVEIYNLQGAQVFSKTFQNTPSATIDLTGNSAGVYVVKVIADGVSYEEKIVKE